MNRESLVSKAIPYTQTARVARDEHHLEKYRVLSPMSKPEVAAAYKMLRSRVLQVCNRNGWRSIGVVGPGAGDGASLTALNLAISISQEFNHTVLLVDLDLRNPCLHRYLGLSPRFGLLDYLSGTRDLSEVLLNPQIDGLVLLPEINRLDSSSELLSTPGMVNLARELKERYPNRMVIYDLPAVLEADDALLFSGSLDAYLMVVRTGRTTADQVRRGSAILRDTPLLGTLLNG